MKKFVLLFLVILFSATSANAADLIRYNNAGMPISIQRNMGMPVSVTSLPNRAVIMQNHGIAHPAMPAMPSRPTLARYNSPCYRRPPRMMNYNFMPPIRPITTVSRLNRNYSANMSRRSYTQNGVTYYD